MEDLQRHLVHDHILDLRREADARRAARPADAHDDRSDEDVGRDTGHQVQRASPVRVRLGHWLIGVGAAVAGSDPDHGAAGHAA